MKPLLKINTTEQDRFVEGFRKQAMRNHNMNVLKLNRRDFLRERQKQSSQSEEELPVMGSGCKGFFSKSYKARQQLVCSAASVGVMFPMVSIEKTEYIEQHTPEFKELLSTLHLDEVGNYVKSDPIILMIGSRLFNAKRKNKDKETGTKISVRTYMRVTARVYLSFCSFYEKQSEVTLKDRLDNAADMYRREVITILDKAVSAVTEKQPDEVPGASITDQKSGLKIYILNLLKKTAHLLMGYFLIKNEDIRSQRVSDFLTVLKLYENEMFGDAYYDLNYRKNVALRKPIKLPKDDDVRLLMDECSLILNSIDPFDYPSQSFVAVRSATATSLTIFCARRGGEPVRLQLYQWEEALKGEWIDKDDLPDEFDEDTMYITYQTGKGSDHLVPVMFPHETIKGMQYLTSPEVRANVGVNKDNPYVFASTQNSKGHAYGWHCISDILKRLSLKGAINATRNRHRVASLLGKLKLSEHEKSLIFNHFGHCRYINENVYQAAAGSVQLQITGKQLMEIHTPSNSKSSKRNEDHNISNCSERNKSIDEGHNTASSVKCKISEGRKVSWKQRSGCTRI